MLFLYENMIKNHNKLLFLKKLHYQMEKTKLINLVKNRIPELSPNKHKGQAGRIGIIGGSFEYTGAPYFSGISALKVGADLVHIFCTSSAATVIKSYSPELIVHPLLDVKDGAQLIKPWLERLHVLVIGPGLGRDHKTMEVVIEIMKFSRTKKIPLVIDADGLFLITERLDLIKDYPQPGIILTPNKIEFERLYLKIKNENTDSVDFKNLGNYITILKKGNVDEFFCFDDNIQWGSNIGGSNRRCGGQGDLLSGSIATFWHWSLSQENIGILDNKDNSLLSASVACYAGSRLIRLCNEKAFKHKGRSMLATDMIDFIHLSFEELFES